MGWSLGGAGGRVGSVHVSAGYRVCRGGQTPLTLEPAPAAAPKPVHNSCGPEGCPRTAPGATGVRVTFKVLKGCGPDPSLVGVGGPFLPLGTCSINFRNFTNPWRLQWAGGSGEEAWAVLWRGA